MIPSILRRSICSLKSIQNGKLLFCTASPSSLTSEVDKYYRTKENNPLNHDDKHLGRLYTVMIYALISYLSMFTYHLICCGMKNEKILLTMYITGPSLDRAGAMSLNLQLPVSPRMDKMHSNHSIACTNPS